MSEGKERVRGKERSDELRERVHRTSLLLTPLSQRSFAQRVEAPDKNFQFLLFAAEPYETIGFKIPNKPIDKGEGR